MVQTIIRLNFGMMVLVVSLITVLSVICTLQYSSGFSSRNVYFVDEANVDFQQPPLPIHEINDNLEFAERTYSVEIVQDTTIETYLPGEVILPTTSDQFESSGSTELTTPGDDDLTHVLIAPESAMVTSNSSQSFSAEVMQPLVKEEIKRFMTPRNTDGLDVQFKKIMESMMNFVSKKFQIEFPGRIVGIIVGNQIKQFMVDNDIYMTYPGTHWCGNGNKDGNTFGIFEDADRCCKAYEECPETIAPDHQYHGLINNGIFRRSHCDCDKKFHACLKDGNDMVSNQIGVLFFNVLYPQCFINESPLETCSLVSKGKCVKYQKNEKLPKQYQWVSNNNF